MKKLMAIVLPMVLVVSTAFTGWGKTYYQSGYAAKSGKNVYYAFTSSNSSTALYKVNIKSKKKTKLTVNSKVKLSDFTSISVKNGYLYCAATYRDNVSATSHIYRISLKSGGAKRLASGINPTVVGDKIVYEETSTIRVEADVPTFQAVPTGKLKEMDLEGKNKRVVNYSLKSAEASFVSGSKQTKISVGKYKFYIASKGKKLVRAKGKTKKTIFSTKSKIIGFRAMSGYVVIKTAHKDTITAYGVKSNGKKKVKLVSWSVK